MRGTLIVGLVAVVISYPSVALARANDDAMPVVARASDGPCRMTVTGNGKYFAVNVTGLLPDEELTVTSESEGEIGTNTSTAAANGSYYAIDIPLVQGKSSGMGTFTVEGSRCRVQASYPWRE